MYFQFFERSDNFLFMKQCKPQSLFPPLLNHFSQHFSLLIQYLSNSLFVNILRLNALIKRIFPFFFFFSVFLLIYQTETQIEALAHTDCLCCSVTVKPDAVLFFSQPLFHSLDALHSASCEVMRSFSQLFLQSKQWGKKTNST